MKSGDSQWASDRVDLPSFLLRQAGPGGAGNLIECKKDVETRQLHLREVDTLIIDLLIRWAAER